MIITEFYMERDDGVILNRTYSDEGYMIERDGILYAEAIDPADVERVYTETNEKIEAFEHSDIVDGAGSDETSTEPEENTPEEVESSE